MDYKEIYDAALERATKLKVQNPFDTVGQMVEHIFPELKESESERIRKELITHFRNTRCVTEEGSEKIAQWVAWLEKQESYTFEIKAGHWYKCVCDYMLNSSDLMFKNDKLYYCRKDWRLSGEIDERNVKDIGINGYKSFFRPATNQEIKDWLEKQDKWRTEDKVESKFNEGDWVIFNENRNSAYQVERIGNYRCYLRHYLGGTLSVPFNSDLIRLWTIQDAKDGDVLASELTGSIFLFRGIKDNKINFYCDYDTELEWPEHRFGINDTDQHYGSVEESQDIHPATKEQRDTLIKAMANAGYTFDFEKKEFKEIEPKILDADKVIEWLNEQSCQGWIEDVEVDEFVDKFKKDFGL